MGCKESEMEKVTRGLKLVLIRVFMHGSYTCVVYNVFHVLQFYLFFFNFVNTFKFKVYQNLKPFTRIFYLVTILLKNSRGNSKVYQIVTL